MNSHQNSESQQEPSLTSSESLTKNNEISEPVINEKVLIIGTGPVGLLAAIQICRASNATNKKTKIVMVSNRKDYTRKQIIGIPEDVFKEISAILGEAIIDKLRKERILCEGVVNKINYYKMEIRHLEEILYKHIIDSGLVADETIKIIYLDKKSSFQEKVKIDKSTANVEISTDEENLKFYSRYIIAADGAHSPSAQFFDMQYEPAADMHSYPYFCTAFVETSKDVILYNRSYFNQVQLANYGWHYFRDPQFYTISHLGSDDSKKRRMLGIEVPPAIYDLKDTHEYQSRIEKWVKYIIKSTLQYKILPAFKVTLKKATQPILTFGDTNNPSYYFVVGDAFITPSFSTARGLTNGILVVKALYDFFVHSHDPRSIEVYKENVNKIAVENAQAVNEVEKDRYTEIASKVWPKHLALMEIIELIRHSIKEYLKLCESRRSSCFSFFYNYDLSSKREILALNLDEKLELLLHTINKNLESVYDPLLTDPEQYYVQLHKLIKDANESNQDYCREGKSKLRDDVLSPAIAYLNSYEVCKDQPLKVQDKFIKQNQPNISVSI